MTTQFLSRVDRDVYRLGDTPTVGPGSYSRPNGLTKALPGFAPFSSSAKRMTPRKDEEDIPAPGSYMVSEGLEKKTGVTSVFKSSARRFSPQTISADPGPAQYSLDSTLGKKVKQFVRRSNKAEELLPPRPMSPPSIPAKGQAHGYEVRPDGALAPQPPAIPGYSGHKDDAVGPGDYNPRVDTRFKNPKSTTFKGPDRSALDRIEAKVSETPGPGYYNTSSSFEAMGTGNGMYDNDFLVHMAHAKSRQLSAFESKTARDAIMQDIERRKHEPGPGQYNIPTAIDGDKMTKPPQLQFFSSSETRFKPEQSRSMQVNVAPGDYNVVTSDFDKQRLKIMRQKKMAARSDWAQNIAFVSTEKRFRKAEEQHFLETPNPTAYYPKVGLADTLPRTNVRGGAFGSKDSRFKPMKDSSEKRLTREEMTEQALNRDLQAFLNKNDRPSQGQAQNQRPKHAPVFAPTSEQRLRPIKSPPGPPPGAYETTPKWIKKHGVPVIAPSLNISRKVYDNMPGPGDYDINRGDVSSTYQSWRNPKQIMLSTTVREDPSLKRKTVAPGPGYYNTAGNLLKPTYNVLLSDKYQ